MTKGTEKVMLFPWELRLAERLFVESVGDIEEDPETVRLSVEIAAGSSALKARIFYSIVDPIETPRKHKEPIRGAVDHRHCSSLEAEQSNWT